MKLSTKKYMAFFTACFIICFAAISFFGIHSRWGYVINNHFKGWQNLRFSQDIDEYSGITYKVADDSINNFEDKGEDDSVENSFVKIPTDDDNFTKILESRLIGKGITDHKLVVDTTNNLLILTYAQPAGAPILNPVDIDPLISQKGVVEINSSDNNKLMFDKNKPADFVDTTLNNSYIKSAELIIKEDKEAAITGAPPEYGIRIKLTDEGKRKISDMTSEIVAKNKANKPESKMPFMMDDKSDKLVVKVDGFPLYEDAVKETINNGIIDIFKKFPKMDKVTASNMANIINSGCLPMTLQNKNVSFSSSPNFGMWFKRCAFFMLLVTIAIVIFILILKYKLIGLVCSICLIGNLGFILACFTGFFKIYPGVVFSSTSFAGCLISIFVSISSCFFISSKIMSKSKTDRFETAIKEGFKYASKPARAWCINLLITAFVLMSVFSYKTNLIASIFQPIYDLLDWQPTYSYNVASFAYSILVGGLGGLIFNIILMKFILSPITSPKISLNFKQINKSIKNFNDNIKSKKAKNAKNAKPMNDVNKTNINKNNINKDKISDKNNDNKK